MPSKNTTIAAGKEMCSFPVYPKIGKREATNNQNMYNII